MTDPWEVGNRLLEEAASLLEESEKRTKRVLWQGVLCGFLIGFMFGAILV